MNAGKPQLCQRCEEYLHIKPEFKFCDSCEMEVLRIWQHNAVALQEETCVA